MNGPFLVRHTFIMRSVFIGLLMLGIISGTMERSLAASAEAAYAQAPTLTLAEKVLALAAEVRRLGGSGVSAPLSDADVEDIIAGSVVWLLRAQEENGHFRYEYAPYEDRYLGGDNIVRQAGTFYQLGEALQRKKGNIEAIAVAMERSAGYFEELSRQGIHDGMEFTCVVEDAESTRCKLGATALVLVGMIGLAEHDDTYRAEYDDRIASYAAFLEVMQKDNGGFRNIFDFESSTQSDAESSYSNGEAFLALVRYHQYRLDETTKERIDETFRYLKDEVPFDVPLYLWVMAAVDDLYRAGLRAEYEAYVKSYTDWRIAGFVDRLETDHNMCAYTEGIALGYGMLKRFLPVTARAPYREEVSFWLAKGSELQVGEDDRYHVTFARGVPSFSMIADTERALGGFLTGTSALTERIDFTQHCLNSYLVWDAIGH